MIAAPYYPVDTPTPSWARLVSGDNNRIVHEVDARGSGLYGGVTPQSLVPFGETVSVLTSAMVQSNVSGGQGIGHSLQGFVRGPTGSTIKVYDNDLLTSTDPSLWITDQLPDYRRVTFINQMPDNTNVEWFQSTWIVKGDTGQGRFGNLEFRDHYSRRYKTPIGAATYNQVGFELQTNENFIAGRSMIVQNNYLSTTVLPIAQGQNISLEIEAFIIEAYIRTLAATQLPMILGLALKMTRESDGGADWWGTSISSTTADRTLINDPVSRSETFVTENAYSQIELVMWISAGSVSAGDIGIINVETDGIRVNLNINDSLESGQ